MWPRESTKQHGTRSRHARPIYRPPRPCGDQCQPPFLYRLQHPADISAQRISNALERLAIIADSIQAHHSPTGRLFSMDAQATRGVAPGNLCLPHGMCRFASPNAYAQPKFQHPPHSRAPYRSPFSCCHWSPIWLCEEKSGRSCRSVAQSVAGPLFTDPASTRLPCMDA
ncbi:hypothetical protein K491DRAFT_524700 [Lophiostoma macrostomum CBS 122681]|uniref:Uncharacterized protein n=1 Tax=Lophiostoma macrostomum CBS 122681 TaxID=1314788 RepID=A0A6A6T1H9_9PLEO|nr:hypothetical protein K491DRAFT_524700 [Lophiostoma macrostomum CBS 122681]